MTSKLVRSAALAALPLTVALAACSSSGGSGGQASSPPPTPAPVETSSAATPTTNPACAPAAGNAGAKPPSNVPTPTDAVFYDKVTAGSTTQYFAYAPGSDVKQRRDAIKNQLTSAGYEIKGTDAEDNEEAELEFEGHGHKDATLQVIHRTGCETMLRLRYGIHAGS